MLVLACLDDPLPTDGTCTTQQWVQEPSLLPPLSIADAESIAYTLLVALASVMAIKLLRKAF
jgi:hypothetical protein